jgi:hypothetical protein
MTGSARRRAGDRHDRPGLGADHEARRGDRHEPRRTHLPCGDHRARAGNSRRGRLRRRDPTMPDGSPSPCPAPRGIPASSIAGQARLRGAGPSISIRMPEIPVKIMMNVGNPERAFDFRPIPHRGVGLARLEFIINRMIGVHPRPSSSSSAARRTASDVIASRWPATRPGELLRRQARRGHRDDRRGVRAQTGDRAPVGLQVQRVRQPDRRARSMSRTRKTRCWDSAARRATWPTASGPASNWSAAQSSGCAKRWGSTNVQIMVPFVRTVERREQVVELLAENGLSAASTGSSSS